MGTFFHIGDIPSHVEVAVHVLIIGGVYSAFLITLNGAILAFDRHTHNAIVSCGVVAADSIQKVALFVWRSAHEQTIPIYLYLADVFGLFFRDLPSGFVQVGFEVDGGAVKINIVADLDTIGTVVK